MSLPISNFEDELEGTPIERIVGTILRYAIKDGTGEIHLQPQMDGRALKIFYLLKSNGELREQMKVPMYVWRPLRAHLEGLVGEHPHFRIELKSDLPALSMSFDLKMSVRDSPHGQDLVLFLTGAN